MLLFGAEMRTLIAGLAFAYFSVFDGGYGAAADAGHAVGAVARPYRLAVFKLYSVYGAVLCAFSAGDTVI